MVVSTTRSTVAVAGAAASCRSTRTALKLCDTAALSDAPVSEARIQPSSMRTIAHVLEVVTSSRRWASGAPGTAETAAVGMAAARTPTRPSSRARREKRERTVTSNP